MKITIKQTTEKTVNIDTPYYGKHENGVFVIYAENKCIEASEYPTLPAWNIRNTVDTSCYAKTHTAITRAEFNAEYERIMSAAWEDMEQNIQAIRLIEESNHDIEAEDPAADEIAYQRQQSL